MQETVKPRRAYDATRRQEQARQTRAAVLSAARELFLRDGYAATTVAGIAEAAGVSVETVYKNFKNKPGVVKACFDVAVAGDDEAVPVREREGAARMRAEPDPRKKLLSFGAHIGRSMGRSGAIQLIVRDAAATDSTAAAVWAQMSQERVDGMTVLAAHLRDSKALRRGVTVEEARDVLYAFLSADLWNALVNERGWSGERYGRWVGRQLVAALV